HSNPACKALFNWNGKPIAGAVTDLAVGSAALQRLSGQVLPLPTHAIFGVGNLGQTLTAEINAAPLSILCPTLLPGGFVQLFGGASDLIVSQTSQEAIGLAFSGLGNLPATLSDNTIHAVDTLLFNAGPDALSRNTSNGQIIG